MLKFIGTGSCFNYKMGNNSAYYIHNVNGKKRFILFDCGEDVFHKILNNNLLMKFLNFLETLKKKL